LTEHAGDSEIVSNELWMPSGAVVRTTEQHPLPDTSGIVKVTLPDLPQFSRVRALINFNKDSGESHWAEVYVDGNVSSISLSSGDSVENINHTVFEGDTVLKVCYSGTENGTLSGWLDDVPYVWDCAAEKAGGYWAGLENTGAAGVGLDDFSFMEHYITNTECPYCFCSCGWICMPKEDLIGTFTASGNLAALDGQTIDFIFQTAPNPEGPTRYGPKWVATGNPGNPACWDQGDWTLECVNGHLGAAGWTLNHVTGCDPAPDFPFPDRWDCEAFFLAWDVTVDAGHVFPVVCSCGSDQLAGWYILTITEKP